MYICECGKSFEKANSLNAHYSHCLIKRKGKKPIDRLKGKRGWSKGMTKTDHLGLQKMAESNSKKRKPLSEKTKSKISKALKGKTGGVRENSNKWRGQYHKKKDGSLIWLDSSYEKTFVSFLDSNDIEWIKNTQRFPYYHKDEKFNYIPDFYLPEFQIWIEVKGWVKDKDFSKWKDFPHTLIVIKKKDLEELRELNAGVAEW